MSPKDTVAADLARSRTLLSPRRVFAELIETDPPVPLDEVGAEAGYGLAAPELGVTAGLYVLRSWSEAEAARCALEEANPAAPGERVATAQNGRLAFIVRANIEGKNGGRAHDTLSNALSAFAGDE